MHGSPEEPAEIWALDGMGAKGIRLGFYRHGRILPLFRRESIHMKGAIE
jgi:hypothetical protein